MAFAARRPEGFLRSNSARGCGVAQGMIRSCQSRSPASPCTKRARNPVGGRVPAISSNLVLANFRFSESATMPASGHARKITLVLTCPFREVKRLNSQILHNKNAVIYGGGGSLGGAIAKAIAREEQRSFWGEDVLLH